MSLFVGRVDYPPRKIFSPADHAAFLATSKIPGCLLAFVGRVGESLQQMNARAAVGETVAVPAPPPLRVLNGALNGE